LEALPSISTPYKREPVLGADKWVSNMLWEDKILGNPPLNQLPELRNLKDWMKTCNLELIADISEWDNFSGDLWRKWKADNLPQQLNDQ
jgi:hypothetical protein